MGYLKALCLKDLVWVVPRKVRNTQDVKMMFKDNSVKTTGDAEWFFVFHISLDCVIILGGGDCL